MDVEKRKGKIARGSARWQASRLEGARKNIGTSKVKKSKGSRKWQHLKKVVGARSSKRKRPK